MTASEMPKVYELPDIAPAPASELQSLLRRFIEYADWGAVRPLLDCLKEEGRHEDAREVRRIFGQVVAWQAGGSSQSGISPTSWVVRVTDQLLPVFVFDLFAPEACVSFVKPVRVPLSGLAAFDAAEVVPDGAQQPWTAEENIVSGEAVALDYDTRTVRVHPAPLPVTEGA